MRVTVLLSLMAVGVFVGASAATNRVKIASVAGIAPAAPVAGVSYITPTAVTTNGVPSLGYLKGVDPAVLAAVVAAAQEAGVPMSVLKEAVLLSVADGVSLQALADVLRLSDVAGLAAADVVALARLHAATGVEANAFSEIIALSRTSGVPLEALSAVVMAEGTFRMDAIYRVLAVATEQAIPPAKLADIMRASVAAHVSLADMPSVVALAASVAVVPEALAAVYAAATVELTEETLTDIIALAITNGIEPADLRRIVALAQINNGFTSRFDALAPRTFSRLWAVKEKAKRIEASGGNTDKLWNLYWEIFAKDAMSEGVDDGL